MADAASRRSSAPGISDAVCSAVGDRYEPVVGAVHDDRRAGDRGGVERPCSTLHRDVVGVADDALANASSIVVISETQVCVVGEPGVVGGAEVHVAPKKPDPSAP